MVAYSFLEQMFLGRPIKPLVFAIAMSMASIFWFNIVKTLGILVPSITGNIVGYAAGASAMMLFIAWWWRIQGLTETGLLMASGVWVARTTLIFFQEGWYTTSFFFSLVWCFAPAGAYLLEVFGIGEREHTWIRSYRKL